MLVISISILISCYSCDKKEDETTICKTTYNTPIPFAIGNYWEYEINYLSYNRLDGKMIAKNYGTHKITVIGDTIINDEKFFLLDGSFMAITTIEPNTQTLYNCKDGIVSSENGDTLINLSTNYNAVNNYEHIINDTKYRSELSNLDTTFSINSTEIVDPFINKEYLSYITSEEDEELTQPISEVIIDKKIGVISITSRYSNIARLDEGLNKNDRYEKKLIDFHIQ